MSLNDAWVMFGYYLVVSGFLFAHRGGRVQQSFADIFKKESVALPTPALTKVDEGVYLDASTVVSVSVSPDLAAVTPLAVGHVQVLHANGTVTRVYPPAGFTLADAANAYAARIAVARQA
jgi:hypothetical protein